MDTIKLLDEVEANPDILKASVVNIDKDTKRYSNVAYELAKQGILPEHHINADTVSYSCREIDVSDYEREYTTYVINALLESKSFPESAMTDEIVKKSFGEMGLTGAHIIAQAGALPDRLKTAEILSLTTIRGNRSVADVLYESGHLMSIPPEQLTNDILDIRTKGYTIREHYQTAGLYPKNIPEAVKWIAENAVGKGSEAKERAATQFFSNAFPELGSKDIVDMYKNQAVTAIKEDKGQKLEMSDSFKER